MPSLWPSNVALLRAPSSRPGARRGRSQRRPLASLGDGGRWAFREHGEGSGKASWKKQPPGRWCEWARRSRKGCLCLPLPALPHHGTSSSCSAPALVEFGWRPTVSMGYQPCLHRLGARPLYSGGGGSRPSPKPPTLARCCPGSDLWAESRRTSAGAGPRHGAVGPPPGAGASPPTPQPPPTPLGPLLTPPGSPLTPLGAPFAGPAVEGWRGQARGVSLHGRRAGEQASPGPPWGRPVLGGPRQARVPRTVESGHGGEGR